MMGGCQDWGKYMFVCIHIYIYTASTGIRNGYTVVATHCGAAFKIPQRVALNIPQRKF